MNANIHTKLSAAICCAFGAAALCALSSSARAGDLPLPSQTVRYDDLDIAKPAGAKVLYSRIRAAARNVCAYSAGDDPILREAVHVCIEKAIDKAVRGVNAPELTALRFGGDIRLASK
jgi:UrcA family protein